MLTFWPAFKTMMLGLPERDAVRLVCALNPEDLSGGELREFADYLSDKQGKHRLARSILRRVRKASARQGWEGCYARSTALIGRTFEREGDLRRAEIIWWRALTYPRVDGITYRRLVRLLWRQNRFEDCIRVIDSVARLYPLFLPADLQERRDRCTAIVRSKSAT